jgi:hypothetical protein
MLEILPGEPCLATPTTPPGCRPTAPAVEKTSYPATCCPRSGPSTAGACSGVLLGRQLLADFPGSCLARCGFPSLRLTHCGSANASPKSFRKMPPRLITAVRPNEAQHGGIRGKDRAAARLVCVGGRPVSGGARTRLRKRWLPAQSRRSPPDRPGKRRRPAAPQRRRRSPEGPSRRSHRIARRGSRAVSMRHPR